MSDYYRDKKLKFQRIEQHILRYVVKHLPPATRKNLSRWFLICLVTISIAHLTKNYIFSFAFVTGESMQPWIKHGDLVFISKLNNKYYPGDIIAVRNGLNSHTFVKRLAAIGPSQVFIEQGAVYVSDALYKEAPEQPPKIDMSLYWCLYSPKFEVPQGSVFVLGDNRCYSYDSRAFGPIPTHLIQGKVRFKILSAPILPWLTK